MSAVRTDELLAIPWYRRLSVRLAALLLCAHVLFLFALPRLYDLGLRLVGLPASEDTILDGLGGRALQSNWIEQAVELGTRLTVDAAQAGPGRWIPTAGRVHELERELAPWDQGFAWLSAEREVIAITALQPWKSGELFDGSEALFVPVRRSGVLAGWLVLLHAEHSGAHRISSLTGSLIGLGFAAVFGALTSFAVSRQVARRLSRLASEVAVPFKGDGDLPGPFDDSGRDEIALLARAMNLTRERAEHLIGRLAERDAVHRAWVAQVSHDLRTPLTALMVCFDRAEMEVETATGDELRECILELMGSMREDAKRVNNLADDLLDVARLDVGDALVIEPVPAAEVVRHVVALLSSKASGAGLELKLEVEAGLPLLEADGKRLVRAVASLTRNSLQRAQREVVIRARRAGSNLRFEVQDDGTCFPTVDGSVDGKIDLRALSQATKNMGSAGLDLVIARKVTQAHRGEIGAENLGSVGAVIWIEIALPKPRLGEEDSNFNLRV